MWSRPPSANSAETLVLIGLILQIIAAAIVIVALSFAVGLAFIAPFAFGWAVGIVALVIGAVSLVFLYLVYEYSYERIRRGEYAAAEAPTLVFGILSLFLGVVPGILYIIAYVKLGDAVREQRTAAMPYAPPYAPPYAAQYAAPAAVAPAATPGSVACRGCGHVYAVGQYAFCPSCGQKIGA